MNMLENAIDSSFLKNTNIDIETGEILDDTEPLQENQTDTYEVDIATGKVTSSVYTNTEQGITALREKYPATLTANDYLIISAGVKEIRKLCIKLEAARKNIKAPFLKACTAIDKEAKRITMELEKISDPMVKIKKQVDDAKAIAEAKRLAELDEKAAFILRIAADAEYGNLAEISAALEQVDAIDPLNGFYERQLVACENKAAAMAMLKAALVRRNEQDRRDREADEARKALAVAQAELAKQKAETEALLAEERAKAENERFAQAEIMRKQQEAQEAERAAQADELRKEREELAKFRAESERLKQAEQARIYAEEEAKRQAEISELRKAEEKEFVECQRIANEEAERIAAELAAAELAASEAEQARREANKTDAEAFKEFCWGMLEKCRNAETTVFINHKFYEQLKYAIEEIRNNAIIEMIGE